MAIGTPVSSGDEPITTAQAKAHLRITHSDDDTYIGLLISAAREHAEMFLRRRLITQTKTQYFDTFANAMELKAPPLQSVAEIVYVDADGEDQPLSDTVYDVDTTVEPGVVRLAYDQSWPTIRTTPNAITVTYVAGYGDASDVPDSIKHALKFLVSHWYENREPVGDKPLSEIPITVERLLWGNRLVEAV